MVEPQMLCAYCNTPWNGEMKTDFWHSEGCATCGHGGGSSAHIVIKCHVCKKTLYDKEIED